MAVTLHPSLSRKAEETVQEEQEIAPVAEAPEAPVELAPEPTSEVSAVEESNTPEALEASPEPAPDPRKWIDPTRYYQELMRLEREDLEFKNALRTRAGRMAATEWKPKVANLEAELAETRKQLQQERMKSLEPEEIKERLYQDPEFRKQYEANSGPDAALIRQRAAYEARVTSAVDFAEQHLPPEEITKRVNALSRGIYDAVRDQSGNIVRTLTPEESLSWFERDLNAATINYVQQANRAPAPAPAPAAAPQPQAAVPPPAPQAPAPVKSNPALAQASPDLSPNTGGRSPGSGIALSEYSALTTPEKMKRFPQGLGAALSSGAIYRDEE